MSKIFVIWNMFADEGNWEEDDISYKLRQLVFYLKYLVVVVIEITQITLNLAFKTIYLWVIHRFNYSSLFY